MKYILLGAALALSACNGTPTAIPSSPAVIADATKIDELSALSAETLYTTASTMGNSLSRLGVIDRARFQALDAEAYRYLEVTRAAYKTGNASTFAEGLGNLNVTIGKIRDLKK